MPISTAFRALRQQAATGWSVVSRFLPWPIAHGLALIVAMLLLSDQGIVAITYEYPTSGLMTATMAGIALLYLASIIRRVVSMESEWRFKRAVDVILAPAASLLIALGLTLPFLVILNDLPVVNALLLDYVETEEFGRLYQPYIAGVYGMRHLIAVLFFVVALALALPQSAWSLPTWEARPLASAIGFAAAGCLAWLLGLGMADLGYGYALGGTIFGAGFFSIAITQMGLQFSGNSQSVPADAIRWLAESKTRSFMPGAAIAVYVLLLRPILYDTLALAAIYEWLAVLVVIAGAAQRMRARLQKEINVVQTGSAPTTDWSKHEQMLETRPDPRADMLSEMRRAWVEDGDPDAIEAYLVQLLSQESASPGSITEALSPLHDRSRRRSRLRRRAALDEAFAIAGRVMDGRDALSSDDAGERIESAT